MGNAKHEHLSCPRCQRSFECRVGTINTCQCQALTLTKEQQHHIQSNFEGCLCADCLLALRMDYNQLAHQAALSK